MTAPNGVVDTTAIALDVGGVGVWHWDIPTNEVEWSETLERIHGFEKGSFGKSFEVYSSHIHPDDRERVLQLIQRSVEGGEPYEAEYRMMRPDGSSHWVSAKGRLLRDDAGAPLSMTGICMDISARRELEEQLLEKSRTLARDRAALLEEERRYRSLVIASTQIVWTMDRDGTTVTDSPAWRELTGQSEREWRERGWLGAIAGEDAQRASQAWKEALEDKAIVEGEFRVRTRDGSLRWYLIRCVPVLDDRFELRELVGTASDIDERKKSENEKRLLELANTLFAETLDYENALARLPELCTPYLGDWCAVDLLEEGKLRRVAMSHAREDKVRLAATMLARYRPTEGKSLVIDTIRAGRPRLIPNVDETILRQMAVDEQHLAMLRDLGFRSFLIVPFATSGSVEGALMIATAESGRVLSSHDLELASELTRRASITIEHSHLYKEAQAANRAKDAFLATLSHELRTPMTSILGWAKLLIGAGRKDPETLDEGLDAIYRSARAQAALIDDVLDVSRIMTGKMKLETADVDLRSVVDDARETVRNAAEAKGVRIETEIAQEVGRARIDPRRMEQVLWNLLTNAIKFTPSGGTVTLRVDTADHYHQIEVTDTGQGIDREFLPFLFEPFRQADSSTTRSHGGLGLGLAIVRYLVEAHGGEISAHSDGLGAGATFRIRLPITPGLSPSAEPGVRADQDDAPRLTLPDLSPYHVLVVDDQEETRRILHTVFERCGARVSAADRVGRAMEIAESAPPDLIVSDIAMPGEDGYSLIRRVRLRFGARIPVLAVTAFGREEDQQRILDSGFDSYVRKPFDPSTLADQSAKLLVRDG